MFNREIPLYMTIFHSYVRLPESTLQISGILRGPQHDILLHRLQAPLFALGNQQTAAGGVREDTLGGRRPTTTHGIDVFFWGVKAEINI